MSESDKQGPEQSPPPADVGYRVFGSMIAGMAMYGGIGWLVGHLTGITFFFPLGMFVGIVLSLLMIILRFSKS